MRSWLLKRREWSKARLPGICFGCPTIQRRVEAEDQIEADSALNSLDSGGDARCVLGVGGSEPEMCDERSQMWGVQQEGTHRESMQVRGKSPMAPAFRGSLVSLPRPLL